MSTLYTTSRVLTVEIKLMYFTHEGFIDPQNCNWSKLNIFLNYCN